MSQRTFSQEQLLADASKRIAEKIHAKKLLQVSKIPKGWFTIKELAKAMKCTERTVRDKLSASEAKKKRFTILSGERITQVTHYKV